MCLHVVSVCACAHMYVCVYMHACVHVMSIYVGVVGGGGGGGGHDLFVIDIIC